MLMERFLNGIFRDGKGNPLPPEKIYSTVLIIPELYESLKVKHRVLRWMRENGVSSSFLPEITSLFDIARSAAGSLPGSIIRPDAFQYIMETCAPELEIPERFRLRKYKSYKEYLYRLLSMVSKASVPPETLLPGEDLKKAGISAEKCIRIMKYIRDKGFIWDGDVYRLATEHLIANGTNEFCGNKRHVVFGVKYHSAVENEFLKILNSENPGDGQVLPEHWQNAVQALTEPEFDAKKFPPAGSIRFFRAGAPIEQAKLVLADISAQLEKNPRLEPDEIQIVTGSQKSLKETAAYFTARGVPTVSTAREYFLDGLSLFLRCVRCGMNDDLEEAVYLYDRLAAGGREDLRVHLQWNVNEPVPGILETCRELKKENAPSILLKTRGDRNDGLPDEKKSLFLEFLERIAMEPGWKDSVQPVEKVLTVLNDKVARIQKSLADASIGPGISVFSFQEELKQVFGDLAKMADVLDYLAEKTRTDTPVKIAEQAGGTGIVTAEELVSDAKVLYLMDLEDPVFLRSDDNNPLLSEESYREMEIKVYGKSKDEYLLDWFLSLFHPGLEQLVVLLPDYSEGTVLSERIVRLLRIFPKLPANIAVLYRGKKEILPDRRAFSVLPEDILKNRLPDGYPVLESIRNNQNEPEWKAEPFRIRRGDNSWAGRLNSATEIQKFCMCPASYVHSCGLSNMELESGEKFEQGNILHEMTEKFLRHYRGKALLENCGKENRIARTAIPSFIEKYLNRNGWAPVKTVSEPVFSPAEEAFCAILDGPGLWESYRERSGYRELQSLNEQINSLREFGGILNFLVDLTQEMGPTPAAVTSTFRAEIFFKDLEVGTSGWKIGQGYIDFLFIDSDGIIRLIDFKSGSLDDYEEEIANYQEVQLLIYQRLVREALKQKDWKRFTPGSVQVKKKDFETVDEKYFADWLKNKNPGDIDALVQAAYFSPRGNAVTVDAGYEGFIKKCEERLGRGGFVHPETNRNCDYCGLNSACPDAGNASAGLDDLNGKFVLDREKPFDRFPLLEHTSVMNSKAVMEPAERTFIRFEGDRKEALVKNGGNIALSAGAGSGKTEVLSSKYVQLLLTEDLGTDGIVCITFTDKAAGEMKKRIARKLQETAESGVWAADGEREKTGYRLTERETAKLRGAREGLFRDNWIMTFHSFCRKIIELYGREDLLSPRDLSPAIASDHDIRFEKVRLLQEAAAKDFSEWFSGSDKKEMEIFRDWFSTQKLYYEADFGSGGIVHDLIGLTESIRLSGKDFGEWKFDKDSFFRLRNEVLKESEGQLRLLAAGALEALEKSGVKNPETLNKLREDIKSLSFTVSGVGRSLPRLEKEPETDRNRQTVKDAYETAGQNMFRASRCSALTPEQDIAVSKSLFLIAKQLNGRMETWKEEKGIIELGDLHHHLHQLLKNNPLLTARLRAQFRSVLVDEFQDTNWLQKSILDLLCGDAGNRLFIVGDMKQSIYRFQQCDNQIFKSYLERKDVKHLRLRENFRSSPGIVGFNNYFFSKNREPAYQIIADGNAVSAQTGESTPGIHFTQLVYRKSDYDGGLTKSELNRVVKIQEANYICGLILKNPDISLDRWAVLIRKYGDAGHLLETLKEHGIPYSFIMKRGLLSLPECREFISILKAAAGLGMTGELSYIGCLEPMITNAKSGHLDRKGLYVLALGVFNDRLYRDYAGKGETPEQKLLSIELLLEVIRGIPSDGGLVEQFGEIDALADEDSREIVSFRPGSVRIMTVHSSKGLEFENVILANVNDHQKPEGGNIRFLNLVRDGGRAVDLAPKSRRDIVDGTKTREENRFWFSRWIEDRNGEFESTETANLLYVAFTRAKKNLFVTMLRGDVETKDDDNHVHQADAKWMNNIEGNLYEGVGYDTEKTVAFDEFRTSAVVSRIDIRRVPVPGTAAHRKREHSVSFPETPDREIVPMEAVTRFISGEPAGADAGIGEGTSEFYDPRETGNLVHRFLETHIRELVKKERTADEMIEAFIKTAEMDKTAKGLFRELAAHACANGKFLELAGSAAALFTECSLVFQNDEPGRKMFLEGKIDLLLTSGSETVIVDYKTHREGTELPPELLDQYRAQLGLYAKAVQPHFPGLKVKKYLYVISKQGSELTELPS